MTLLFNVPEHEIEPPGISWTQRQRLVVEIVLWIVAGTHACASEPPLLVGPRERSDIFLSTNTGSCLTMEESCSAGEIDQRNGVVRLERSKRPVRAAAIEHDVIADAAPRDDGFVIEACALHHAGTQQ